MLRGARVFEFDHVEPKARLHRGFGELALGELDHGAGKVLVESARRLPPEIAALDDIFADQVAQPRFYMSLLTSFAMLGLILAAIGVYGVMAYSVARRTQEFGVRLALGAQPADIVRMVVASGARVVAAGAIAGLAGALAATRLLSSLLFEVKPRDPLTFVVTAALLVGTALAACWFAARRATAIDLSAALRRE